MPDSQQYDSVCRERFDEIIDKLDKMNMKYDEMNKKLYYDNGSKSLQSRVNESEFWCSVMKWFTVTISAGVLLGFVGLLFWGLQELISK